MYDLNGVKAWLLVTVETWDGEIQALMDRALDAVERDLDWYFGESRSVTEVLAGALEEGVSLKTGAVPLDEAGNPPPAITQTLGEAGGRDPNPAITLDEPRMEEARVSEAITASQQVAQVSVEFMRRSAYVAHANSLVQLVELLEQDQSGSPLVARARGMASPLMRVVLGIVSE